MCSSEYWVNTNICDARDTKLIIEGHYAMSQTLQYLEEELKTPTRYAGCAFGVMLSPSGRRGGAEIGISAVGRSDLILKR